MSRDLVQAYLNRIDILRKTARTTNEQVIRPAFRGLLDQWSARLNMIFVEELVHDTKLRTKVYPDGTVFHSVGVPFGHWEAKDPKDKLEDEIDKKLRKGYPQENIIFENSETAILWQDRREAFRCSMQDTDNLLKLLNLFFGYERPEIAEFRKAVEQFKTSF